MLGLFFTTVLVADGGDNAYAYLAAVGGALIVAAVPFVVAALLPAGSGRRVLTGITLGLLAVIGVLSLALLILSVVIIPSQNYPSDTVLFNHIVALVALAVALVVLAWLYRRSRG